MKKYPMKIILVAVAISLLAVFSGTAQADKIVDMGNVGWEGSVVGIGDGGVMLNVSVTKSQRPFALSQIKAIVVNDVPDLEIAENARVDGDNDKAVRSYEQALKSGRKPWMKDYINARLVTAYSDANRPDAAVRSFIVLAQGKSPLASQVKLPVIRDPKSHQADAVLAAINAVLSAKGSNPQIERLKEVKIGLLVQRGNPEEVLPMIEEQLQSKDVEIRSQARLKQIELQIQMEQIDKALKNLTAARSELDAMYQPHLFFYEGRCLFAGKKYVEAAISFMHLPVQFPMGKELAAEALVWAARSMEKAGVPQDEVAAALQEAVSQYGGTAGAAEAAEMLKAMSSSQAPQQAARE